MPAGSHRKIVATHTRVEEPSVSHTDLLPDTPTRASGAARVRRVVLRLLIAVGAVALAIVAAWIVDMQIHAGEVARNTDVAGLAVGGLDRAQLTATVDRAAERLERAVVTVHAPGTGFDVPAERLGLKVRRPVTVENALDVGRTGNPVARIWSWAKSFFSPQRADVAVDADATATYLVALELDKGPGQAPVEPSIRVDGDEIVAVEGRAGRGINGANIVAGLPGAATRGLPLEVTVERTTVPALFTVADAERAATEAASLVDASLDVRADEVTATLTPEVMRRWLRAVPAFDQLVVALDPTAVQTDLERLLEGAGTEPVDAGFRPGSGGIEITPSETGTACCATEAVGIIDRALRDRPPGEAPLELPLAVTQPERDEARALALGISEVVGSFTTRHPSGQPRVANIHRMADIVRGAVIEPGETFSINDFVGKRTVDNGFVTAPIIGPGNKFAEDVGGGVSQFATTAFNAAFFAGLEIPEYQFHTIYIDRYPYGREATLAYPHPDLKITNTSPYGVLIWPSYTSTEITVTLYSTKWVDAEQSARYTSIYGRGCTAVTTERTRTFLSDGHTEKDTFKGSYVPAEGATC
jgi:vancomycin resistance protein YoaR